VETLKVLWISDFPLRGSSFGTVTHELLTRMPPDFSFDVLSLGYKGVPLKINENIRILELEKAHQLHYYFNKLRPDVTVVFHSFWLLDSMQTELSIMPGKKILYIPCEGETIPNEYLRLFSQFDIVATPSEFSRRVMKKYGIEARVIPHGVDTEFFKPRDKPWHEFRFGYLGMNDIRKQVPRIMEAYARLKEGLLVLATPENGAYKLSYLAKQYNITPIFIETKMHDLTMTREAVRDFLQSLDVYISPASESFGLPALEAQACGVPVIALEAGASPEVLGNGALYCNAADYLETSVGKVALISVPDLYRKMRFLIQVREAYMKTAQKALENAKKWPWENAVEKLKKVIEE